TSGFRFDSNLPVFVVSTRGGTVSSSFTPMTVTLFDRNDQGRTLSTEPPVFMDTGVIKTRGSSTGGRQKASYSLEIQDSFGDDKDVTIFDFPPESDYILYGAYNFDRCHMRNAFMYEISNNIGRYAVRTRFCEVYVVPRGPSLDSTHYRGVYTFMEKVKRGEQRVDVERLGAEHTDEPDITGGYMIKVDRLDPGDRGFQATGGGTLGHVYPKEQDVTEAQRQYLLTFFVRMNQATGTAQRDDPDVGFRAYLDEFSWIDHHLLNELTKNPDALRLSTYLHKKRDGKLENGPIWDFDRTLGPDDDGRAQNPIGWMGPRGTAWWGRLLIIPSFLRNYKLRWQELRGNELTEEKLFAIIDRMAAEIGESGGRDAQRWRQVPNQQGFVNEVNQLKSWVRQRLRWMDTQLVVGPAFSVPAGRVDRGISVHIEAPSGEIYYTINGEDPQGPTGRPIKDAVIYTGEEILINENTRIRARVIVGGNSWSPMVEAIYVVDAPQIAITEINYFPSDDFAEFVEIQNVGDEPIAMDGTAFDGRLDFVFAEDLVLQPGEYAVIVEDLAEYTAAYGEDTPVLGEYSGRLSNSRMRLEYKGPVGEPFIDVEYDDDWHPSTDGEGYTLVLRDPSSDPSTWEDAASWRASSTLGGTPGRADSNNGPGGQLHGDLDQNGQVNITDAIGILANLFQGADRNPCLTQQGNLTLLNVNGDDAVNLSDAVYMLAYLFIAGPAPTLGLECAPIGGCPDVCAQ
ncbi:MAG: CotH kinase family protein, partial [Planctomycetota bacterium]